MTPSLTVQARRFQFVIAFSVLLFAVGQADAESRRDHEAYDFHYDVRYPGQLRSDVGLDTVTEANADDLRSYNRRTVEWWPKRGMDITPLEDIPGAPLRTWTPRVPSDSLTGTLVDNFPQKPFKAHFVGFRGVGDPFPKDVTDPTSYRCPAVVLRLKDGRKRVFLGRYLSEKDRKYVMKVYHADRARMEKALLPDEYALSDEAKRHPEGKSHLYKKEGHVRFDSKHFSVVVPAKPPLSGKSWVKKEDHKQVLATIKHLSSQVEAFWAYQEYGGALMRFWKGSKRLKYVPTFGHGTGGGGGGYGGCTMGRVVVEGVFHEWGHGMACGGLMYPGGAETACDALQMMGNAAFIHKAINQVRRPWKTAFFGQYPGAGVYDMMSDDPNWGYVLAAVTSNLAAQEDRSPMHVYAHLGEERGLWKKGEGIRGVGDMFGQIGARRAEFDFQQEYQYRHHFVAPNRSFLMAVDKERGIYRCPPSEAPEPFGVSISRLLSKPDAKQITVDFQGDFDPDTYSDWRACIVAMDKNDTCRYTPLWNKGKMSMEIQPGDKRYWLTVTATPKALLGSKDRTMLWAVYEAGYAYSYPYQVTLEGCTPGSPFNTMAENYNMTVAAPTLIHYRQTGILDTTGVQTPDDYPETRAYAFDLPPRMTPEQTQAFAEQLKLSIAHAQVAKAKEEKIFYAKHKETDRVEGRGWKVPRPRIDYTTSNIHRLQQLLDDLGGAPHPNGGGWVSAKSHADPTTYVGPTCYVLGGAKVLDQAQLIDGAVVIGESAVVKDHAKLSGKGGAIGDVEVSGYGRLYWPVINRPKPGSDAVDVETIEVTGIPDRGRAAGWVANYDCLQPEAVLLEDLLNRRITRGFMYGYHTDYAQMNYDGHLVGSPGFDPAGGSGAYVFNGKDQYADLAPDVADMGEILVAMRVKLTAVTKRQALLDFGGNADNRFMLTAGPKGTLTLSWAVGGETQSLTAPSALQGGQWTDLQLSFDGTVAVLRIDGSVVAQATTSFRPADAFPPTLGRRNLVMRSREDTRSQEPGGWYCAGALDYLRVYSHVPTEGESLPPVPLASPTRTSPEITEKIEKAFGNHPYMTQAYQQLTGDSTDMNRALTWNDRLMLRKYTYEQEGNPKTIAKTRAMRDAYYEMEAQLAIKKVNVRNAYFQSPDVLKQQKQLESISKEVDVARQKTNQARDALKKKFDQAKAEATEVEKEKEAKKANSPEMKAYQEELAAYNADKAKGQKRLTEYETKLNDIRKPIEAELAPKRAALKAKIAVLEANVKAREELLRETEGPVAKVFSAAIANAQTDGDRNNLIKSRDRILSLDHRHNRRLTPGEGIFYRDLALLRMRTERDRLKRDARAMVNDRLIANKAYMTMTALKNRTQSQQRRRPPVSPVAPAQQDNVEQAFRELPESAHQRQLEQRRNQFSRSLKESFEPYANKELGAFILNVEKAKDELQTQYHENAKFQNPEEFRVVEKIDYKRIHFGGLQQNMADQRASDIEPPDSLGQMEAAAKTQKLWYTTTDDWDTHQRYEADYDQLN
ncbi:MAG: DUF6055 domain-containing protein, partial [Kiritimatiellae bacterium]|nr:DUF6055 domain-containing protein [Kiritimatiellia bacterium]